MEDIITVSDLHEGVSFLNLPPGVIATNRSSGPSSGSDAVKGENNRERDSSGHICTHGDEMQDYSMMVSTFKSDINALDFSGCSTEELIIELPKNHNAWSGSENQLDVAGTNNFNLVDVLQEENKSDCQVGMRDCVMVSNFDSEVSCCNLLDDVITTDQLEAAKDDDDKRMSSKSGSKEVSDCWEGKLSTDESQPVISNSIGIEVVSPVEEDNFINHAIENECMEAADRNSNIAEDDVPYEGSEIDSMPRNEESIIISECPSMKKESPQIVPDDASRHMTDEEVSFNKPSKYILLEDSSAPPYIGDNWTTICNEIDTDIALDIDAQGTSTGGMSSINSSFPPIITATMGSRKKDASVPFKGGEFESSDEWSPPSIAEAMNFKKRTIFREGIASLWRANVTTATDLSIGVVLYFEFAKAACHCMFILTILSIPSILISYSGSRIPLSDQDFIGFSQFTIGNIGYNPMSPTYLRDSTCKNELSSYVGKCINVLGREVKLSDAESVLTLCEILQILVFYLFILHLNNTNKMHVRYARQDECKIEDYTLMCRRLPKKTTMEELSKHFNSLYPLDSPDWLNREPIKRTRVVQCSENSGNNFFIGTWVADCILFHAIGKGISAFKLHENWTINLFRSRSLVSMYSEGTCHKKGPNPEKKIKAQIKLEKVIRKIENLTECLNNERENFAEYTVDKKSGKLRISPARVVAGFLTFEYCESLKRCVDDYSYYNSFPRRLLFYPKKLLFKGKKIKVEKAPDPGEVIWEHLEIPGYSKRLRRLFTFSLSFLLLIVGFIGILQASIYQNFFNSRMPNGSLCFNSIPLLFGAYENITDAQNIKFVRPSKDDNDQEELDDICNSMIPDSFYAIYSKENDFNRPVAAYDFAACNSSITEPSHYYRPSQSSFTPTKAGGTCPNYGQKVFCPCISKRSHTTCYSSSCSIENEFNSCKSYEAGTLGSCYCEQMLNSYLKKGILAFLEYLRNLRSQRTKDSCSLFFTNYSKGQGISNGTIFLSILVNAIIIVLMKRLSKYESHVSVDREDGTLMFKIFIFTYFNMAFSALIAFGRVPNMPEWLQSIYIFQGRYTDFSSEWYSNVGVYFLTTYFFKSSFDVMFKLVGYVILNPLKRYRTDKDIKSNSSEEIVTQYELNKMQVGPVFPSSMNNAYFLSMLFFSMTYACGLPLLIPMAFILFSILFHVDRLLLLRYNRKPPHMGDGTMKIILRILPFAAIIRLCFSCWMLGNSEIFDGNISSSIYSDNYNTWLIETQKEYSTWFSTKYPGSDKYDNTSFIIERVFRPNVFPLLSLLILIIIIATIQLFWIFLPFFWIDKLLTVCDMNFLKYKNWNCGVKKKVHVTSVDMSYRKSDVRVLRINNQPIRHSAPFTGEYFCHLPRGSVEYKLISKNYFLYRCICWKGVDDASRQKKILYMNQENDGWVFIDSVEIEGKHSVLGERGCAYKLKKWTYNSHNNGNIRTVGDPKMTYEVIQDSGCSSYSLHNIPGYMLAIKGLKEGNSLLNNSRHQRNGDENDHRFF